MGEGKNLVGVDIGSSSIKVCQVKSTKSGYILTNLGFVELPNETIVDGQVKNPSAIVLALKEVFSAAKIRQRDVGVSVSAQNVIIRKITVPMMTSAELDEQIRWEAEQHIPFDIKDVHVDYEVLRKRPDENQMDLLLVAARREQIADYTKLARDAKLRPVICDIDAFVLQNLFEASRGLPNECVGLLNVGASLTSLNILTNGIGAFTRDIVSGGNTITETIQKRLGVSFTEAEAYKCGTATPPAEIAQQLQKIIESASDLIAAEIQRSVDFFIATSGETQIHRLYLTGGAANLPALAQAIERRVRVPVELWSAIESFTIHPKSVDQTLFLARAAQLGVALGLTLRKTREARA